MSAQPCSVSLLGPPRIRSSERTVGFRPDLRYRLLAYLAHCAALEGGAAGDDGGWVPRERIAFLFWPDSDDGTARKRLSQLLRRLARLPWLDGLERDPHRLRWRVASDEGEFRAALRRGDTDRALALYRGPFLDDFGAGSSVEYSSWLEHERSELHGLWRDALLRNCEAKEQDGDPAAAAAALQTLVDADPLDEIALQRTLRALAAAGRSGAALQRYRAFADALRDELGIEPSLQSREIARRIETETLASLPVAFGAAEATELPLAVTPFVGRDLELAAIAHHLAQPECRLVTVVGPGGVGKSRLALQAARERPPAAPERVAFATLEAARSAAEMLSGVARALGVDPGDDADATLERIGAALGAERCLLVLDNLEQIADAGSALAELLRRCPRLVCLATSRERLGLRAERLVTLGGLDHPVGELPLTDAVRYDAIQLFVQHARRVRPDYRPADADLPHLIELCRALQGLPLALELAANWLRATGVPELAAAIRDDGGVRGAADDDRGFDLLASEEPDAPDRHRSIRAAFEHSWRLLTPAEQLVLRTLAVFRDGFRREGAERVAGASLPLLTALVDKSLLRTAPGGRYDRHPLLYRFSAEKLAAVPDERSVAEERHARYHLDLLLRQAAALTASPADQRAALAVVEAERENLRLAWRTALARGWTKHVVAAVEPLERFLQRSGHIGLLRELFAAGVTAFEARPEGREALGLLLAKQGWYAQQAGDLDAAVALSERSLALLRSRGPSSGQAQALNTLGFVAQRRQRYGDGARWMRRALEIARDIGDLWYVAGFGNNLAIIESRLGNHDVAEDLFAVTLELNRRRGDAAEVVINLLNFGELAFTRGDPERAGAMFDEGLELAREIGFRDIEPFYLAGGSLVELERGAPDRARELCLQALELMSPLSDRPEVADRFVDLGRIELRRDDASAAARAFGRALELSHRIDYQPGRQRALAGVAEAQLAQGRPSAAVPLLALLARQDDLDDALRARVEVALGRARSVEPSARDLRGTLDTVVTELLLRLPFEGVKTSPPDRMGDSSH